MIGRVFSVIGSHLSIQSFCSPHAHDHPRSVRAAWGEEATEDFERWFDEVIQDRAVPRDTCRTVFCRRTPANNRRDRLGNRCTDLRPNVINMRGDVHALRMKVNEQRFRRMNERLRAMTRWTVGTIALFGTLMTILLAIAEFAN